ncbi:M16 family metallopeptidase [Acidobacteriota bacterium]
MRQKLIYQKTILLAVLIAFFIPICFSDETSPIWKTNPKITSLENGITLIHERDQASRRTVVHVLVKGGKRAEPQGKEGLVYLTTRLAINIPDQGKIQDLMDQATRLNMDCESDHSIINISCLTENLEESLETTTEIMRDPLISGLRINAIKRQMNRRREASEDDSIVVAYNTLFDIFFAGTAYGGSIFGSEESLKAIKKKDIENYYKSHFVGRNMIVAVSTDLDEQAITELITKFFKKFPPGTPLEMDPMSINPPQEKVKSIERDTEQTFVAMAFPLGPISPKNLVLASMLENHLGKGFNSLLWPLRTKQKLAYVVNSRANQMREGGFIEAYLETENSKKDIAFDELEKVMRKLYDTGLTEEDLETTKIHTQAHFLRNNETRGVRLSSMAYFETMDLGYDFINQYFHEINATTLEEMNTFIKTVLDPERAIRITVGPEIQ